MKDEGNIGAARWRTGWLNRRDDEIDDESSSGTVDEGRRGVAMDDIVEEEAPAGWRTEEGVVLRRGFSRPRCMNGWADGMGVGNHGLGTLSVSKPADLGEGVPNCASKADGNRRQGT